MRGQRGVSASFAIRVLVMMSCLCVPFVWALDPVYEVNVSATQASQAIKQLAQQTEHSVLFLADDVDAVSTNTITGRYTVGDALASLLNQTNLTYSLATLGVITVTRAATDNIAKGIQNMQTNDSKPSLFKRMGTLLVAALIAGPAVSATDEAAEQEETWIEEIIVTAEKRDESILDVPVTMSAFSEEMIEQLGITADEDLENLVPGLQFGYDYEGQGVSMRGIGTHSAVINQADSAVAFYVDGVYSYKPYGIAPNMFDLERIEVARGPQGTMNGRNSIAGSISFITQKPTDTWDVNVLAEFTDQVTQRYGLAFGGPITDQWSFRLTGSQYDGDGTQENLGAGDDYGKPDQQMWSSQLRFNNDRVDMTLRYSDLTDKGTSRGYVRMAEEPRDVPSFLFFGFWEVPNPYFLYDKEIPSIAKCGGTGILPARQEGGTWNGFCTDLQNKVLSNRGSQQLDSAERWVFSADVELTDHLALRYTYGEHEAHRFLSNDGDGTDRVPSAGNQTIPDDLTDPADIAMWVEEGAEFQDTDNAWFEDDEEESHELQLFSDFDGPFNFVAGIYSYEGQTGWQDRQQNWASAHLYMNAEEAVRFIDWDLDGAPDWSSCDDFYNNFVIAEDDEDTEFVEGLGEDPGEVWGCAEGDDHSFKSGGGAGSASESKAVFISGDYRFNPRWQVSGGLRWLEDKKRIVDEVGNGDHGISGYLQEIDEENLLPGHPVPWGGVPIEGGQVVTPAKSSWSETIGHVSVEFTPTPDILYYGRVSTGYRAGGFNESGILDIDADPEERLVDPTFPAEELINYELGIKGRFLDQRLTVMAGAYFEDFKGYHLNTVQLIPEQRRARAEEPFEEFTASVAGTRIWGIEVEGAFYINENWRLSGFYAFLDSEFGPHRAFFDFESIVGIEPEVPPETIQHTFLNRETGEMETVEVELPRDVTGNRLPKQPQHKGALTLQYETPLPRGGTVSALTTWSYTGSQFPDEGNLPYMKVQAFDRWDFRTTWESPSRTWNVTAYVQNILDDVAIQDIGPLGTIQAWLTEQRQIGLQVRYRPQF